MQTTLVVLKPDCIEQNLVGKILNRFAEENLKIVGLKMLRLSDELLDEHYAHHCDKPFFADLKKFMQRTSVVVAALAGENAVELVRKITGATNPTEAEFGTLRAQFGTNIQENILHASDSPETAEIELKRFFKNEELFTMK